MVLSKTKVVNAPKYQNEERWTEPLVSHLIGVERKTREERAQPNYLLGSQSGWV